VNFLYKIREKKIFFMKIKIHTMSNFTISFTKVVRTIVLFMLKKNLDLFFRSINTPSWNSSVKVEEEGGFQRTHRLKTNQLVMSG